MGRPVLLSVPPPLLTKNKKHIINHLNFTNMDKKDFAPVAIQNSVSERAYQALDEGKGNNAVGMSDGITVGMEFMITGIDYRESLMPPRGMSNEDFQALGDKDREEQGVLRGWFVFTTNNGDLSFTTVMGDIKSKTQDFWTPGENDIAENFNVMQGFDASRIFTPSCRTPKAWIKQGVDGLIGDTLVCVATKKTSRDGLTFKSRAFMRAKDMVAPQAGKATNRRTK